MSSYYYRIKHRERVDPDRKRLKQQAIAIHTASRGAAGARTIAGQLTQQGDNVGRYKAGSLMREARSEKREARSEKRILRVSSHINTNIKLPKMNRK